MSDHTPFHPSSAAASYRLSQIKGADLRKIVPEKRQGIIIPPSPFNRVLVPIHFGSGQDKSRLCRGSILCEDCLNEVPLTFHLYVGGYEPFTNTKIIVALGTAIPKRWATKLPSFDHPFEVWRQTSTSPIMIEEKTGRRLDKAGFEGWDCMPDVLRIFKGRLSGSSTRADFKEITDIVDDVAGERKGDEEIPY